MPAALAFLRNPNLRIRSKEINMGAVGTPIAVKDSASLSAELIRIADICHGCRRCFTLCPSFEVLFKGLDVPEVDGEAPKLPKKVLDARMDGVPR